MTCACPSDDLCSHPNLTKYREDTTTLRRILNSGEPDDKKLALVALVVETMEWVNGL